MKKYKITTMNKMKITWVVRSFSHYRVPVYEELDKLCGHELTVIYYKDAVPQKAQDKLLTLLGKRAIARTNEIRFGNGKKLDNASTMRRTVRIPISPGLIKQVIDTKPEVLISDAFMQWTYAPLIVRAFKGIPHVMCYERTAHTERNSGIVRKWYRKFVSNWIDIIDCNGNLCGQYVKELLHWGDDRLTYGHMVADVNGMINTINRVSDADAKQLRDQLGVHGTMLLFVGQLIDRKGVLELLDAWREFKKEDGNSATLVFVGTGARMREMQSKIKEEKIPDVSLVGAVDYNNVPSYYKAADCFVLPTMEDNWSLVIPEAMACGLPVATTIYNGCHPELVTTANGWVFDSMKRESIKNVLHDIVRNSSKLTDMGEESKRIVANYTAHHAAKSIMDAIQKAKARRNK